MYDWCDLSFEDQSRTIWWAMQIHILPSTDMFHRMICQFGTTTWTCASHSNDISGHKWLFIMPITLWMAVITLWAIILVIDLFIGSMGSDLYIRERPFNTDTGVRKVGGVDYFGPKGVESKNSDFEGLVWFFVHGLRLFSWKSFEFGYLFFVHGLRLFS